MILLCYIVAGAIARLHGGTKIDTLRIADTRTPRVHGFAKALGSDSAPFDPAKRPIPVMFTQGSNAPCGEADGP